MHLFCRLPNDDLIFYQIFFIRFDRYKLGFNDVTAGLQKYKVLCQYSQLQRRLLKMDNSTLLRVAGFAHPQKFKLNGLGNFGKASKYPFLHMLRTLAVIL